MENRYEKALEGLGMKIEGRKTSPNGVEIITATAETKNGILEIVCGSNGCARLAKPNGSIKWVYEKSYAQIRRIAEQTIEANN